MLHKKGVNLTYISQYSLTGTSVTSDGATGNLVASIKYMPFGDRRNSTGTIDTDRQFTGQRLDGTGLYYYGARYYDPGIGRFISADTIVQSPANPQTMNRYAYVTNNPLRYIDPSGMVSFSPAPDPPANVISEPPWFIGVGDTTTNTSTATAQTPSGPVTINRETSTTTWPTTPAGTVTAATGVTTVTTSGGTVTTITQTTSGPGDESTTGTSPAPSQMVKDAVAASPLSSMYTGVGALLGSQAGVTPFAGPNNTVIYENVPPGSRPFELLEALNARAVTIGHVVFSGRVMDPRTLAHEEAHVRQYDWLGPLFLPIYVRLTLEFGVLGNPLEVQARRAAGEE